MAGILIIRLKGLGDIVHVVPSLEAIRRSHPHESIGFLCQKPFGDIIPPSLGIKIFQIPSKASLFQTLHVIRMIRREKYDKVFDLFSNPRTALISLFSGISWKAGFNYRVRKFAYNHIFVPQDPNRHLSELFWEFFRKFGFEGKIDHPNLEPGYEADAKADEILAASGSSFPLLGLNPHASYPSKAWPPEHYESIAKKWFDETGSKSILFWGPGEEGETQRLIQKIGSAKVFTHPPLSIRELLALISKLDLFVTADTGPMNIAWAQQTPTIALFGPTTRKAVAPKGPQHRILYAKNLECLQCHLEICPRKDCMTRITPDDVFKLIKTDYTYLFLKNNDAKRKAVFIDRDGTLNPDPGYISHPDSFHLFPGVGKALAKLKEAGYLLVLITNQSGIARRLYNKKDLYSIHEKMTRELMHEGVKLDRIYFCPHHPDFPSENGVTKCHCRKPAPGMFLNAIKDLNINPKISYAVGDKKSDTAAARQAGVVPIMIGDVQRSGKGDVQIFPSLATAIEWILYEKN